MAREVVLPSLRQKRPRRLDVIDRVGGRDVERESIRVLSVSDALPFIPLNNNNYDLFLEDILGMLQSPLSQTALCQHILVSLPSLRGQIKGDLTYAYRILYSLFKWPSRTTSQSPLELRVSMSPSLRRLNKHSQDKPVILFLFVAFKRSAWGACVEGAIIELTSRTLDILLCHRLHASRSKHRRRRLQCGRSNTGAKILAAQRTLKMILSYAITLRGA